MAVTLSLFGGVRLADAQGVPCDGRAGQRRRLAVLAILAAARGEPVARERIIALLWPEVDTAHGRRSLVQSLHVIHKELDEDPVVRRGGELALDLSRVRCDVVEFWAALEAERPDDAVSRYAGPFLAGLVVEDAPEFAFWADRERERLEAAFAAAVERVAAREERSGAWARAAAAWRRLAAEKPECTPAALRLARALDGAGDRAAALRHLQVHAAYLREVLDLEEPAEVRALVARLRSAPDPSPAVERERDPPGRRTRPRRPVTRGRRSGMARRRPIPRPRRIAPGPQGGSDPPPATRRRGLVRLPALPRWWWGLGVGAAMLVVLAGLKHLGEAPSAESPVRVAVGGCAVNGADPALAGVCAGMMDLVTMELSGVEALEVVRPSAPPPGSRLRPAETDPDSLAARMDAQVVISGSLERAGGRVRHTLFLREPSAGGRLFADTMEAPAGEPFALEESLARRAARLLRGRVSRRLDLAALEAGSENAEARRLMLRAYGERARALAEIGDRDTIVVAVGLRRFERVDTLLMRAEAEDRRWPAPVLQRAWTAWYRAQASPEAAQGPLLASARAHAARVLHRDPRVPEALELRALVLWAMANRAENRDSANALIDAAARAAASAVDVDERRVTAWTTLSQVQRYQGRHEEAYYAAIRAREVDQFLVHDRVVTARLFRGALAFGRFDLAARHCADGARDAPGDWRFAECPLTLVAHVDTGTADTAAAAAMLARLDQLDPPEALLKKGRNYARVYRHMLFAAVLARAGAPARARQEVALARSLLDPRNGDEPVSFLYDQAHVLLFLGDSAGAQRALADLVRQRPQYRRYIESDYLFRRLRPRPGVLLEGLPHPVRRDHPQVLLDTEDPDAVARFPDHAALDAVHPLASRQVDDQQHLLIVRVFQRTPLFHASDPRVIRYEELLDRGVTPEYRVVLVAAQADVGAVLDLERHLLDLQVLAVL